MKGPLKVLGSFAFVAAVFAAALGGHPTPVQAETNGICQVLPSPAPSITAGAYPIVPACGTDHNLQVDIISGGGSGGGGAVYPAPSSSPFPIAAATTIPVSIATTVPVSISPTYARTAKGGSITTGGTAQTWAAAGTITHGCQIQNTSTGAEYVSLTGSAASATAGFYLAPNGGSYSCDTSGVPTTLSSIFGATTGQTYYGETW